MREVKDSEFHDSQKLHRGKDMEIHIFPGGSEESICGKELKSEVDGHRCNCRACIERFRDKYDSISKKDVVKFVDAHHAMNDDLKAREGEKGLVDSIDSIHHSPEKAHVQFDDRSSFWINLDRLEIVEKFDES